MNKLKLQELCQKRKWEFPWYATVKDGLDHLSHFTISLTITGLAFELSKYICQSSKNSKNVDAKIAFDHLNSDSPAINTAINNTLVLIFRTNKNSILLAIRVLLASHILDDQAHKIQLKTCLINHKCESIGLGHILTTLKQRSNSDRKKPVIVKIEAATQKPKRRRRAAVTGSRGKERKKMKRQRRSRGSRGEKKEIKTKSRMWCEYRGEEKNK
ncbi:hypothetical protein M9H77_06279 [Catharanthus roseus]|uniref:Uncharacterized protein n=1 Tax=Catharanthus roseus TaxID=4058 RepID=A0ACC0BRS5_CATRO|nr:hypothetical protein M9H77_06279 [Catharanthus roseus]